MMFGFKSDNETVIDELIKNFVQKQLELNSKLTSSLTEKENTMNHLKETINLVKNVIISQYKVNNIFYNFVHFSTMKYLY